MNLYIRKRDKTLRLVMSPQARAEWAKAIITEARTYVRYRYPHRQDMQDEIRQYADSGLPLADMPFFYLAAYRTFEEMLSEGLYEWIGDLSQHPDMCALTNSPAVILPAYDANGDLDPDQTRVWWYPNYMIDDPLERLFTTGIVDLAEG